MIGSRSTIFGAGLGSRWDWRRLANYLVVGKQSHDEDLGFAWGGKWLQLRSEIAPSLKRAAAPWPIGRPLTTRAAGRPCPVRKK